MAKNITKIIIIYNNKENANQDNFMVFYYLNKNGKDQEINRNNAGQGVQGKRDPHSLLLGL